MKLRMTENGIQVLDDGSKTYGSDGAQIDDLTIVELMC